MDTCLVGKVVNSDSTVNPTYSQSRRPVLRRRAVEDSDMLAETRDLAFLQLELLSLLLYPFMGDALTASGLKRGQHEGEVYAYEVSESIMVRFQ